MRKIVIMILSLLLFASVDVVMANDYQTNNAQYECPIQKFETLQPFNYGFIVDDKLNLSADQVNKMIEAKTKTAKEMQELMAKINDKTQEAKAVKLSRMAVRMQIERLAEINKEVNALQTQVYDIRKQNMKQFEENLSWKQKMVFRRANRSFYRKFRTSKTTPSCFRLDK